MSHAKLLARITARPEVFGGKPIVRDMRISVELVLSLLAQGITQEELLQDYPRLEPEDIRACIAYAHAVVAGDFPDAMSVAEPSRNQALAEMLAGDFYDGRLDFKSRNMPKAMGWELMPEVAATKRLLAGGVSYQALRQFLTFTCAMDRARDSNRLWQRAVALFQSRPEVFSPADAAATSPKQLRAVLVESGVSQRHGPDADAWHDIACSLVTAAGPALCRVIDCGAGDAQELLRELKGKDAAGRSRFPLLRGPKIGSVWVRIMAHPGGAKIDRIETIPVAVDVQVRRPTENLGVANTKGMATAKAKPIIQCAWRDAVGNGNSKGPRNIAGTCAALDPALWVFGKYGCSHCKKEDRRVQFGRACGHCQATFPNQPNA